MTPEQEAQNKAMLEKGWVPLFPGKYGGWTLSEENRKAYHQSLFEDAKKPDKAVYQQFKDNFGKYISEDEFESLFGYLNHN